MSLLLLRTLYTTVQMVPLVLIAYSFSTSSRIFTAALSLGSTHRFLNTEQVLSNSFGNKNFICLSGGQVVKDCYLNGREGNLTAVSHLSSRSVPSPFSNPFSTARFLMEGLKRNLGHKVPIMALCFY